MEASNGSVFLPLLAILGWIGLTISWFLVQVGETELGLETGLGELNLEFSPETMLHGVALSLIVWLTFPGAPRKMHAQLRTASVTLSFGSTVWRRLKMYAHHIGGDERVNPSDDDWDDLWDESADQ